MPGIYPAKSVGRRPKIRRMQAGMLIAFAAAAKIGSRLF